MTTTDDKTHTSYQVEAEILAYEDELAARRAKAAQATADGEWLTKLLTKDSGAPRRAYHNTAVFVRYHPEWAGRWSYDEMTATPCLDGRPAPPELVHQIRAAADQRLGYTPPPSDVEAAVLAAAKEQPFHPVLAYLRGLVWDGVSRLGEMARDYLGSDDPLHAEMVRRFMIGAAARALWPGCKLDTALMLVGDQGLLKSTFFAVLGGRWHADSHIDITSKDAAIQLHSAWIYELAELENVVTGRSESRLKAWMTSSHDLYRPPYARIAERRPRAGVIVGTTNRRQFLTDPTGSRRFWIVPVSERIPRDLLEEMRDQLWAEALHEVEQGQPWWFEAAAEREREEANQAFVEEDSWSDVIARWLARPGMDETSTAEILTDALDIEIARHDHYAQVRVGRVMSRLGWRKVRCRSRHTRYWVFRRPGVLDLPHNGDA